MKSANDLLPLIDELAGYWTEPVLEILKVAGVRPLSVTLELEAWRALRKSLHAELRWQRAVRLPTLVSLSNVMERSLREAALLVAQRFAPQSITFAFESRVRRLAAERRSTLAERRLFAEIVRQPALRAAFRPPSRTDFTPHLRVSALSG